MDDPALYVLNQITQVLTELRVEVNRYNIFEVRNEIATLPATLQKADGVILESGLVWEAICSNFLICAGCMLINRI